MALGCGNDDPTVHAQSLIDVQLASVTSAAFLVVECGGGPALTHPAVGANLAARGQVGKAVNQVAEGDAIGCNDHQITPDQLNHPPESSW
jgi:hypothetical protein